MKHYIHPELGQLVNEEGDWIVENFEAFFLDHPSDICLDGSDEGPSEAALEGYQWLSINWDTVLETIGETAFQFYESYQAETGIPKEYTLPDDLWESEEILNISITSSEDYSVTMRFLWQIKGDDMFVTFYVEKGKCVDLELD